MSSTQDEMKFYRIVVDKDRCKRCGFCSEYSVCKNVVCIGCLACYPACPYEARGVTEDDTPRRSIKISVDGVEYAVPEAISIKRALEICGYTVGIYPDEGEVQAPCSVGGCYACSVIVNDELTRSCITSVGEGMEIETDVSSKTPLRIVHGPQAHRVGGKATPWTEGKGRGYVEVAIWTAGCNLRCPQCQNYHVTYDNNSEAFTPSEAAKLMTWHRRRYNVDGLAVSGGEPTLNKHWLIQYFKELRKLNPDRKARLHLDSNGTLLTHGYIDDLVEAGCNNIGVEPKGVHVDTFMEITGIKDKELAERYLKTSWEAAKYLIDEYEDKVYVGIGVPYNPAFITLEEVVEIGEKIASIDPSVQVCVLDYFPTFRRTDIKRPTYSEMLKIKNILNDSGLSCVIVQTEFGHIGP